MTITVVNRIYRKYLTLSNFRMAEASLDLTPMTRDLQALVDCAHALRGLMERANGETAGSMARGLAKELTVMERVIQECADAKRENLFVTNRQTARIEIDKAFVAGMKVVEGFLDNVKNSPQLWDD